MNDLLLKYTIFYYKNVLDVPQAKGTRTETNDPPFQLYDTMKNSSPCIKWQARVFTLRVIIAAGARAL